MDSIDLRAARRTIDRNDVVTPTEEEWTTNPSEWDTYSEVYDRFYGSYRADIEHLGAHWDPAWWRVFEIGSGTGRLLPFLQSMNVTRYVGFEPCKQMAEIACRKDMPKGFELQSGDRPVLDALERFDLVLYAFNTANYLGPEELEGSFRLVARHLRPDGRVFADLFLPFALSRGRAAEKWAVRERVDNGGGTDELCDERRYDDTSCIETRHHEYVKRNRDGVARCSSFKTWRRYYSVGEFAAIAARARLELFAHEPYGSGFVEGFYVELTATEHRAALEPRAPLG